MGFVLPKAEVFPPRSESRIVFLVFTLVFCYEITYDFGAFNTKNRRVDNEIRKFWF